MRRVRCWPYGIVSVISSETYPSVIGSVGWNETGMGSVEDLSGQMRGKHCVLSVNFGFKVSNEGGIARGWQQSRENTSPFIVKG